MIEPSWPEIFKAAISRQLKQIHTALPGFVRSYDPATRLAEIELAVLEDPPLPRLKDVPVQWAYGGSYYLHFPLAPGDQVLVHFSESEFGASSADKGVRKSRLERRHGLYALAVPFLWAPDGVGAPDASGGVLGRAGGPFVSFDASHAYLGGEAGAQFVALANLVKDRLDAIQAAFDSHIHVTTCPAGAGSAAAPSPPLGPLADVAATKAKAV